MTNVVTDNSLVLAAVLSLAVVPLASWLKRDRWPQSVNFLIALLLSVAGGVLTTLTTNKIHSWHDLVLLSGVTLASSQAIFHLYFNGSGFDQYLSKIGSVAGVVDEAAKVAEQVGASQDSKLVTGYARQVATAAEVIANDVKPAAPIAEPAAPIAEPVAPQQ